MVEEDTKPRAKPDAEAGDIEEADTAEEEDAEEDITEEDVEDDIVEVDDTEDTVEEDTEEPVEEDTFVVQGCQSNEDCGDWKPARVKWLSACQTIRAQ